MSYAFKIIVSNGHGTLVADESTYGTAPDGSYVIAGHAEPNYGSVNVTQLNPGGYPLISISGYYNHVVSLDEPAAG